MATLHWSTVTPALKYALEKIMLSPVFEKFRLVGGTSLSLQLGHRKSIDIDLFTDARYNSIDFNQIENYLNDIFPYVETSGINLVALGTSYYIGNNELDAVKLDLYYTDPFIRDALIIEGIRLATLEDVIAMKIDVISRKARKKDFWDLHELINEYSLPQMIAFHQERYPYGHNAALILKNLTNFDYADNDFEPICLKGKYWEVIKLDFTEIVADFTN